MKHMAIIPARLASTRLPKKPLQIINNKALIVHVAEEVLKTKVFTQVYVATDSKEVFDLFEGHPVTAVMTSVEHQSGTDRINEASNKIDKDFDTVFNIQGDEPFIYKEDLLKLKEALESGSRMASLYEKIKNEEFQDLNKVKVVLNNKGEALYFSRFGIPFSRENISDGEWADQRFVGKHIGVYAYQKEFLKVFCDEPLGHHENFEKLEQLRALQMGEKIKMVFTQNPYHGVDTKEDLVSANKKVKEILSEKRKQ